MKKLSNKQTSLLIPENVLFNDSQTLNFNKIATLIGGNGSGKSTILKSIFDGKLIKKEYKEYRIVCFSSGQNESYSYNFSNYLNKERKTKPLNLDCFYYDKSWSKLLIFLATSINHEGLVRNFLKNNNYVSENEFDEDETTTLSFKAKVDESYINIVKNASNDENKGSNDLIINGPYHRTLKNFIKHLIDNHYEFEKTIEKTIVSIKQKNLSKISFEKSENESFESKILFFTQASDNDYFIIKGSFELFFEKNKTPIKLEELSDGEYQLLFVFSLIDIFDSENTLFLFDEADSHLHFRNIDQLWREFFQAKGLIITTTHLIDSINKSGINNIKIIENGKIENGTIDKIAERLKELSDLENTHHLARSFIKNIVLIDDINDWEIFKALIKQKLKNTKSEEEIENSLIDFIPIKCPSGYGEHTSSFAFNKLEWLNKFLDNINGNKFKTKNVFLICDRDELPLASIGTDNSPLLVKSTDQNTKIKNIKKHVLSWKRREIKHYLLSHSALISNIDTIKRTLDLGEKSNLQPNASGDYTTDNEPNEKLATIKSEIVKKIVHNFISNENGFCKEKTKTYVENIPQDEISEDIVSMYNYLINTNGKY